MTPSAYPEASRLVYRIRAAVTGESNGLETAKLAWQFAEAVDRANADLDRAEQALEADALLTCLLIEQAHPRLLETAQTLDHPLADAWRQRCETFGWRLPAAPKLESVSKIQSAIEGNEDLKGWLYKQYRSAVRAKDRPQAYQAIALIAERFPDDPSASEEAASAQQQLLAAVEAELKDALEQLIPAEQPDAVLQRYLGRNLPLDASANPTLQSALSRIADQRTKALAADVQQVLQRASALDETNWPEHEAAYLACDYQLAIHEARGAVDSSLRAEFESLGSQIARLRSSRESIISIRQAIAELRQGKPDKGKTIPLANRREKLKSLETQAVKTGIQIPPDLQLELKQAYAHARRRRLPLFASLAAASLALVLAALWLVQARNQQAAEAQRRQDALLALQQTEQAGEVAQAEAALSQWQDAIATAEPASPLLTQAEILQDWIDAQASLNANYASSVEQLEASVQASDALDRGDRIAALIASIRKTRSDLAPDLGSDIDTRFEEAVSLWTDSIQAADQERRQELARLQRELSIALRNAGQAKSQPEFERLRDAALDRIESLSLLMQDAPANAERAQLASLSQSAEQQLAALQTKWQALAQAWQQLDQTANLDEYLRQLERIHSFDILPADQKNAINQTLRLRSAFQDPKAQILYPSPEIGERFAADQDYLAATPSLSTEEAAFIEELQSLDTFANVYQSTVQYFEGEADPESEYAIYLVEPIAKSDSQETDSHITFTFRVRGFDEFGNREESAREIQFISRSDGSFWGFFYKPSTLSPESEYFRKNIRNTLSLLQSGADRLAVVELIDSLEGQRDLSPAFKVFWQQRLIEFMQLSPWKWGYALSPRLKTRRAELASLPSGSVSEQLWLSTIEQTVPSPEYALLTEEPVATTALAEIRALASLHQQALQGSFSLAGAVDQSGALDLDQGFSADAQALWTVNTLTGELEALSPSTALAPFAPVLHYQLPNARSPDALLEKAQADSDLPLAEPPYRSLLPPILTARRAE